MLSSRKVIKIPAHIQDVLKLDPTETLDGDNSLYFKDPSELLELFNKLEAENLALIQACQQVILE